MGGMFGGNKAGKIAEASARRAEERAARIEAQTAATKKENEARLRNRRNRSRGRALLRFTVPEDSGGAKQRLGP